MSPLRLALNHTRLDAVGGVEGYVFNLIQVLLDRGHSIDFFGGKFPRTLSHPNLRLLRVPYLRSPRPLRVASFAHWSARAIQREERRQAYDVVQGFSRTYYHTLYRDGAGCRADYCELYLNRLARRGLRRFYYAANPVDWLVRSIEKRRYVTRPQRVIIAISSFVRDQILRRYPVRPETVRVVYSGVDTERFHPRHRAPGRARLAELLGRPELSDRDRVLAFVGNDYHRKGLDLILEAFARLPAADRDAAERAVLIVAGADARAPQYERLAARLGLAGRVGFLGKRHDVHELLAGADGLLLPSYFDAYSNVSSEALASGTPVIASPTSGAAELITGACGWVLQRNSAEDLLQAILELVRTKDLFAHRAAARDRALPLSWDCHYREIEAIYREVADAARRPERSRS